MYEAATQGVVVRVRPSFVPEKSEPPQVWVWAYEVEIENRSKRTVQLVGRRWLITDALGRVQKVTGFGVVGEQPILKPGERHTYSSGCPLPTSSGSMVGSYNMMWRDDGDTFDAAIPAFSLDVPGARRTVN